MIVIQLDMWPVLFFLNLVVGDPQYAGYMQAPMVPMLPMMPALPAPPPPPPRPVPVPYPVPVPMPIQIQMPTKKPTTEETQEPIKIIICPPRLPNGSQLPPGVPFPPSGPPMPFPAPPPVLMVPFPPIRFPRLPRPRPRKRRPRSSSSSETSSDSDTSDSSTSDDSDLKRKDGKRRKRNKWRRKKRRKYDVLRKRRSRRSFDRVREEIKPELVFVSGKGNVKIRKTLSKKDALTLLNNDDLESKIRVVAVPATETARKSLNPESSKRSELLRKLDDLQKLRSESRGQRHVFRPAGDKKVSNLEVSYNLAT